jgi:hypothetical protein
MVKPVASPVVSRHPLHVDGGFGFVADGVLRRELPELPDWRRAETVEFVCRRARSVPGPLRLGVVVLSIGAGLLTNRLGPDRTISFLRSTRLPFVSELARMVRSLGFAFVWETWPDTQPSGAPG